jgi:hypothetical protein
MTFPTFHLRCWGLWFVAAGCLLGGTATNEAQEKADKGSIRISPSILFTGELARLYPHLDLAACGCVKVDFEGPKTLVVELDVWQNGKAKPLTAGSCKAYPFKAGEISLSVRETVKEGKEKYKIIITGGGATFSLYADMPAVKDRSSNTKILDKTVTVAEASTVAVWAFNVGKGTDYISGEESVEETAKRVEWALVLKISVEKKQ